MASPQVTVGCCGADDGRGILALALLPAEIIFWIGFALPFGPVLGLARTVLVVAGWSSLGAAASVAESPANR